MSSKKAWDKCNHEGGICSGECESGMNEREDQIHRRLKKALIKAATARFLRGEPSVQERLWRVMGHAMRLGWIHPTKVEIERSAACIPDLSPMMKLGTD